MKKRVLPIICTFMLLIICMLPSAEARDPVFPDNCPEIKVGESKSGYLSMWSSDVFYKFVPEDTGYYKITMSSQGGDIVWTPDKNQIRAAIDDYYTSYYKLEKEKTYYIQMYCNSSSNKSVTMTLETADFITLKDSTVTTLTMNSSQKGLYEFVPEKDGLYRFDISVSDPTFSDWVYIYSEGSHIDYTYTSYNKRHFASLYLLKKGVTYYGDFSCSAEQDTVVNIIARPETITPLSLSNTHQGNLTHISDIVVLSFTPQENGFYKAVYSGSFTPRFYNSDFGEIRSNFSQGTNNIYGYEPRYLEAGKTYHYLLSFSGEKTDYSFTMERVIPENLHLTDSTQVNTAPYESKLYKFVPSYEGIYNFTIGSTVCDGKSANSTVVLYDKDFNKIISSQSYVEKKLDAGETYYYTLHPSSYSKENTITYSFMGERIMSIPENAEITAEITTAGEFKYYKFTPSYSRGAVYDVSVSGTSTPKVEVCDKNLEASISKTSSFTFEQATKEDDYTILKVGFSDSQETGSINLSLACHELIYLEKGKEYTTNITKAGDYRYFYYDGYSSDDSLVVFDAYGDFTSSIAMLYSPSDSYIRHKAESKLISESKQKYFMVKPSSQSSTGEMKVKVTSYPFYEVGEYFDPVTIEIKNPGDCAWIDYSLYASYPDEIFSIISEGDCDTYVEAYKYGVNDLEYAGSDDNSGEGNNFSINMTDIAFCCVKLKDDATGTFNVRLSSTSNKKITLGKKTTFPCTVLGADRPLYSSFVYTPTKSGLYEFIPYENPESGISTTCEIYNPDGKRINYGSNIIYLQENTKYLFRCRADSNNSGSNSYFTLKKVTDSNLGELPLDNKQIPNLPSGTTGYYTYTAKADETLYLISENGYPDCIGYFDDFYPYWTYINSETHQTFSLVAGAEYVICCTNDLYAKILKPADNTTVTTSSIEDLKSGYYENNMDKSWIYTAPEGTLYNEVTFSPETVIGDDDSWNRDDYLYVYDADGSEVGKYTGYSLKGKTVLVKGDTFRLRLVTNNSWINYGFVVSDVKNANIVPTPSASIQSGVIKPSSISLSGITVADIYYKIDTASSTGEYVKYTEPFDIIEDCTLTAYAEINGVKSESISYQYKIDAKPIAAPVITADKQSSGYVSISATAAEGKIYYRYIGSSSIYEYKNPITLTSSDVLEFYAQLGNIKSQTVIYKCEVKPENETYLIKKPDIETKPVLGGYEVTVALPEGVTLCDTEYSDNYAEDHPQALCGNSDYGYSSHTSGKWKYSFDNTELSIAVKKLSGTGNFEYYTDSSDIPEKYTITETASIKASIYRRYENSSGTWRYYTDPIGETMHVTDRIYDEIHEQSEESFVFIEVPKAAKPLITTAANRLYVYSQDDSPVYYSINDSEPVVFTTSVSINSGDTVKAYAIDYGIAQSDVAEHTYTGETYINSSMKYELLDNEVAFSMSEAGVLSGSIDVLNVENTPTNAMILLAAYDKETDQFITMTELSVESVSDITRLDNIQLSGLEGKEFYVKAFMWEDLCSIKPISMAKTIYITPDASISANEDISEVTLSSPKEISGEVIVALYDSDDRLLEIDVQPASSIVYPQVTETADYAKIMWWDMNSIKPVCAPETKSLK